MKFKQLLNVLISIPKLYLSVFCHSKLGLSNAF